MAAPFVPKPPKRGRIPVSAEDRAAARSGMDGNKLNSSAEPIAAEPVALVATEPAAPAPAPTEPTTPLATELVAPTIAPGSAATESITEPTIAPTVATASTIEPESITPTVATVAASNQPAPRPTTAPPGRPRGRKPAVATAAVEPAAVRSVKIKENVWSEIRLVVAQLPNEEDSPRNIQAYVEAAHLHYLAYLRKQGKLPSK